MPAPLLGVRTAAVSLTPWQCWAVFLRLVQPDAVKFEETQILDFDWASCSTFLQGITMMQRAWELLQVVVLPLLPSTISLSQHKIISMRQSA